MPTIPTAGGPDATASPAAPTFLALLPTIHSIARLHFRHVACPGTRNDLTAEAVALAWVWCTRLIARGKDPAAFPVTLARLAAKAAGSGRRVCGQLPGSDALSPRARHQYGSGAVSIPADPCAAGPVFQEALADNTRSAVPDQVQFRQDFPAWLHRLTSRHRRMVGLLALGHRTRDVAERFRVSPARVSQLRRQFRDGYLQFLSAPPGG